MKITQDIHIDHPDVMSDDTVRTYNGEPASDFGLDGSDAVLCWDKMYAVWYLCEFASLEKGDQWRKQPPAPETDGNAMSNDKPKPEPVVWLTEEEWDFIRDTRGFWEPSGVNRYITAKHGNPGDIDWALANAEHWMRECEELERQLAEAQRDLLTREEGGEWVSRCDHEDALAEAVKKTVMEMSKPSNMDIASQDKRVQDRLDWLEAQLAEARKDADALRAELATAKADTERLDWLEQGGWEVYPSGRKYCIAHDIYDAVYATELRQAIDNAMKEDER